VGGLLGYLGPPGSFSEAAAIRRSSNLSLAPQPYPSIDCVFEAVESGSVVQGIVPVENSLEGSVNLTYDLLSANSRLQIVGEILLRIRHQLLARPEEDLGSIREIYSHPQAFAQCRIFLNRTKPEAVRTNMISTVEGIRLLSEKGGTAVIASERAADLYGLKILCANIQDEPLNITRFLVLALHDAPPTNTDKTSLLLGLPDTPGSLYRALGIFARSNLNLTKIESRPLRSEMGKYRFFLDVEGHRQTTTLRSALKQIRKNALFLKVLGSYPAAGSVFI